MNLSDTESKIVRKIRCATKEAKPLTKLYTKASYKRPIFSEDFKSSKIKSSITEYESFLWETHESGEIMLLKVRSLYSPLKHCQVYVDSYS